MTKFTPGQKVRVMGRGKGRRGFDAGAIVVVGGKNYPNSDGEYYCFNDTGGRFVYESNLEPLTKTLDDLAVGDVLVSDGDVVKYTVQATLDNLVACALESSLSVWWVTLKRLKDEGWTIKGEEPEADLVYVTLEEIAKFKGIPVERLRIKED